MSRGTRARRAKRRARKAREVLTPSPPSGPVDWERIAARYGSIKGRAVTLRYVLYGPIVPAKTPEELEVMTAVAVARLMADEPVN